MKTLKLNPDQWKDYFDNLQRHLGAREVEIEIIDQSLGAQKQIDWAPIIGLSYDHKGKVLSIAVEGIEHLVPEPKDIFVLENGGVIAAIEIIGRDSVKQIVRLRAPLQLPHGS